MIANDLIKINIK